MTMTKKERIKSEKIIDGEQKSAQEKRIDEFIDIKEINAAGGSGSYSFPLMMRLDVNSMARLEHLAKMWKLKKSNLACQLLDEMIVLVMDRYYKDKTPEEYFQIQKKAYDEFYKRIESMKKKKVNK
ncbi:MAG: hypothetical protein PHP74_03305 [Candidatus Gracilibacteria bacterium]|nr:hypothetical protein [Candidatus Gracilibacteria bacterium]